MTRQISIPAEIFTHDGARRAAFEASGWFAAASSDRIVSLARSTWCAKARADDLEQYALEKNEGVAEVL